MSVHPPMTSEPDVTLRSAQMSTSSTTILHLFLTPLIDESFSNNFDIYEYHKVLYFYFAQVCQGSSFGTVYGKHPSSQASCRYQTKVHK
jgi:hypothetical protein